MVKVWPAATLFIVMAAVLAGADEHLVLRLERRFTNASTEDLVRMDHMRIMRHTRQGLDGGVAELPVTGKGYSYPSMSGGAYLARVQLGTPPRNFSVLIDTGSSLSWVTCHTPGVPELSGQQTSFDPSLSSTSSPLACSDTRCQDMVRTERAMCSKPSGSCEYYAGYGPGSTESSGASGYFLSEVALLETVKGNGLRAPSSAPVIFGCSTQLSGELAGEIFDGIFGFGPYLMSFSSQMHAQGLSSGVFSLCMNSLGGGILVFGEVLEPGLVYTSLVPSQEFYEVRLESIMVNGQELPVEPREHRTVIDSGTKLAFLADDLFNPFVDAILAAVSPSVSPVVKNGDTCFVTSSSVELVFPTLKLQFVGGAAMTLEPKNYLRSEDTITYCIAWSRNNGTQVTILGDIVLMDKIIVHDLQNMQLGWKKFDCARSVRAARSTDQKHVSSGHVSYKLSALTGVAIMLAHTLILCAFSTAC